jgi:hypothetical protein
MLAILLSKVYACAKEHFVIITIISSVIVDNKSRMNMRLSTGMASFFSLFNAAQEVKNSPVNS